MQRVLVTGSSGLIGSALVSYFEQNGWTVVRLVRSQPQQASELYWEPLAGVLEPESLEGFDAVVHLAGENISAGRWTPERKTAIYESRVQGTRLLSETLVQLSHPPKVLACASAIGYYGDRGDEILTEESPPGSGFLAQVCEAWEAAADIARQRKIRVVHLRFGIVLSARGGALARMLPLFKMGLGGKLGKGEQYMSWIALDDVVEAIAFILATESLQGAINIVAPQPVRNREFTEVLGRVLGRPTFFSVPAFVLKLLLGEMAEELLLSSTRVKPTRLLTAGYSFRYPDLEGALQHVLGVES